MKQIVLEYLLTAEGQYQHVHKALFSTFMQVFTEIMPSVTFSTTPTRILLIEPGKLLAAIAA